MKVTASVSSTELRNNQHEWIPCCFDTFLRELTHIKTHCTSTNSLVLFRGHRDSRWLLDSTFKRHVKENILGISLLSKVQDEYRHSLEFHRLLGCLLLYKFGTLTEPSQELYDLASKHGIDPWFEWLKRIQQYPKDDLGPLQGSFVMDWTQSERVATYFADELRSHDMDGAVWIADITATGKVLRQGLPVAEILGKYQEALHNDRPFGIPLVFYPEKQLACHRADNQETVYVAQMDLRFDLAEIWSLREKGLEEGEQIYLKLILPKNTKEECDQWLSNCGLSKDFIYPE